MTTTDTLRAMNTVPMMGYKLNCRSLPITISNISDQLSQNKKVTVSCLNPHSWVCARHDKEFAKTLTASSILLADGVGVVLASRLLNNVSVPRITGHDFFVGLSEHASDASLSVFFLGGSEVSLEIMVKRYSLDYPNVKVVGSYAPPFEDPLSDGTLSEIAERIMDADPTIVFVGLGSPKQDKWIFQNSETLPGYIYCGVGAVFDFYAGTVKRPPAWLRGLGLEWLGRLIKEPKRLANRTFISAPVFLAAMIATKIQIVFTGGRK